MPYLIGPNSAEITPKRNSATNRTGKAQAGWARSRTNAPQSMLGTTTITQSTIRTEVAEVDHGLPARERFVADLGERHHHLDPRAVTRLERREAELAADAEVHDTTGQPDDVASVIAFLASDDARWITGDVIAADGGSKL